MSTNTFDSGNNESRIVPIPAGAIEPGNGVGSGGGGNQSAGSDAPTTVAALLEDLRGQAEETAEHLADSSVKTQYLTKSKANLQKQIGELTKTSDALAGKRKAAADVVASADKVEEKYRPLLEYQIPKELRDGIDQVIDDVNKSVSDAKDKFDTAAKELEDAEREMRAAAVEDATADQALKAAQAALNGLPAEVQDLTARVVSLSREVESKHAASQEIDAYWRLQQLMKARGDLQALIEEKKEQQLVEALGGAATAAEKASAALRDKTVARDTAKVDYAAREAEWKAKVQSREADIKRKIDILVNMPPGAEGADTAATAGSRGAAAAGSP